MYRNYNSLRHRAMSNQEFFAEIDKNEYGVGVFVGNAAYVVQQANDLLRTEQLIFSSAEAVDAYRVHTQSDISRILAILHRQCLLRGFDFLTLLAEGVEYEEAVVKDIKEDRRPARSHKGLNEKVVAGPMQRLEEMENG